MKPRAMLWVLLPAMVLSGCTSVNIEGEDKDVVFPTLRLSRDMLRRPGAHGTADRAEDRTRKVLQPTYKLDMELSFSRGDFDQNLGAGEIVVLSSGVVSGPDQLEVENDIYFFQSSARGGFEFYEIVTVEGLVGVGINYIDTEVKAASGNQRDDQSFTVGPLVGGRAAIRPHGMIEFYGQVMFLAGIEVDGTARFSSIEVGVGLTPVRPVTFQIAWRRWNYESDSLFQDYDIEHSGLMLGAQLNF